MKVFSLSNLFPSAKMHEVVHQVFKSEVETQAENRLSDIPAFMLISYFSKYTPELPANNM